MADTISKNVLHEILLTYVRAESRPSPEAIEELADAVGRSVQEIMNDYATIYHADGGDGDPWGAPSIAVL